MKKLFHLVLILLITHSVITAAGQTPQAMNYQAIARNSLGAVLQSQHINIRFSIHDGSPNATITYQETDTATTNQFGLFTTLIGNGTATVGIFSGIAWPTGNKYLEVELDPAGGNSFSNMGTTQLVSVPFALYAANSGNTTGAWNLNGNGGTDSLNFIGTTDSKPFNIRVNNQKAGVIDVNGGNSSFGVGSLYSVTSGEYNTAIGQNALVHNTTSSANTAIGAGTLYYDTSAGSNTACGYQALYYNSSGYFNTAIGSALYYNTTGIGNTAVGQDALHGNATGNNNMALGYGADVMTGNLNNATALGYNAKVSANNSLILGGTGAYAVNVGIGTSNPGNPLEILAEIPAADSAASAYQHLGQLKLSKISDNKALVMGVLDNGNGFIQANEVNVGYQDILLQPVYGNVGIGTGIHTPSSRLTVDGGDIYVENISSGVIIKSPNAQCWRITISNSGTLTTAAISCP